MSRLCRNNMVDFPQEYTPEAIVTANTIEKFKLTREQYNTISNVHNSQVGHFGLERTLKRLTKKEDSLAVYASACQVVHRSLFVLSENEYVKDTHTCSWLLDFYLHTYGML